MSSKKEFLSELVKDNDLNLEEDIFRMPLGGKQVAIITRTGIEKIQYNNGIDVKFTTVVVERDFVAVKAVATIGDVTMETFGSALYGQGGNCRSNYIAEMAGFNSRATFNRIFKRITNKTPSEYIQNVYSGDLNERESTE